MKRRLTWLHISDWHQGDEHHDRDILGKKLCEYVKHRDTLDRDLKTIDFVIFSGDIAATGKKEQYEAARKKLIDPLRTVIGENTPILIVAGNHDVDRQDVCMCRDDDALLYGDARQCRNAYLSLFSKGMGRYKYQFRNFHEFRGQILPELKDKDDLSYSHTINCNTGSFDNHNKSPKSEKVGIICLNSAWLSARNYDVKGRVNDYGYLLVGEPQVHSALNEIMDCDIKIAVLHHPLNWLRSSEEIIIRQMLESQCHFILHGHEHIQKLSVIDSDGTDTVYIPAGASYSERWPLDPNDHNAFNFTSLDVEKGIGKTYFVKWVNRHTQWQKDGDTYNPYFFSVPDVGRLSIPETRQGAALLLSSYVKSLGRTRAIRRIVTVKIDEDRPSAKNDGSSEPEYTLAKIMVNEEILLEDASDKSSIDIKVKRPAGQTILSNYIRTSSNMKLRNTSQQTGGATSEAPPTTNKDENTYEVDLQEIKAFWYHYQDFAIGAFDYEVDRLTGYITIEFDVDSRFAVEWWQSDILEEGFTVDRFVRDGRTIVRAVGPKGGGDLVPGQGVTLQWYPVSLASAQSNSAELGIESAAGS